jgi:opacity protein-like surface antigen
MRRFLILLGFFISLSPAVFAAGESPFELSFQAGDVLPQDAQRINNDKDSHYFGTGRLTYDVSHYSAVGVEVGWMRFVDRPSGVKSGHLYEVPLMGDVILKYPIPQTDNRLVPYAIGGLGVAIGGYRREPALEDAGVKVKADTEFAYKAGVGTQFFVTKQAAIFAEGSYFDSKFDPKVEGGSIGGKIRTRSFLLGGGLAVAF